MKVKCVRLLNADGDDVDESPWCTIGRTYHVMYIWFSQNGVKHYGIIAHHPTEEWPQMVASRAEGFEIVSDMIPSNWQEWKDDIDGERGISPAAWQITGFSEAFYDHDPSVYPIFERERDIILSEDP